MISPIPAPVGPWYDGSIDLDPDQPPEAVLMRLPGKWAVYLLCDADGRPVQLLAVRNLRASVRRRVYEQPEGLSKKLDYRAVVRSIRWRRVDSALESDLAFLDIAREVFPDSYRQLITQRKAWFVHVDPDEAFPRWTRVESAPRAGVTFGPMLERNAAGKLCETIEDAFDLCRYHNILSQAPRGTACAYKDMGRCPAPCDGSVSMQQYRALVRWSCDTLINPQPELDAQHQRMLDAAGELRFEVAQKIKLFVEALESFRQGDWRFVRPLADFRYLSLQPGPGKGLARLFAITPERVDCIGCLRAEPKALLPHLDALQALRRPAEPAPLDEQALERLGIVVKHLFSPHGGSFIHGDDLTERSLAGAYRQIARRASDDEEPDDEGVIAAAQSA